MDSRIWTPESWSQNNITVVKTNTFLILNITGLTNLIKELEMKKCNHSSKLGKLANLFSLNTLKDIAAHARVFRHGSERLTPNSSHSFLLEPGFRRSRLARLRFPNSDGVAPAKSGVTLSFSSHYVRMNQYKSPGGDWKHCRHQMRLPCQNIIILYYSTN